MDQQHQWAYQQNQTMLGCGLMGICLFAGIMIAYYSGNFLVWLTVPLLLGVMGLFAGLMIARLGAKRGIEADAGSRGSSVHRQIVNEECVACQQRITSIMDGVACSGCGAAFHRRCVRTGNAPEDRSCPQCQLRVEDA